MYDVSANDAVFFYCITVHPNCDCFSNPKRVVVYAFGFRFMFNLIRQRGLS